MTRLELDYRLAHAVERGAAILVAFYRLAAAYHATHGDGLWLTCADATCRANASNLRRWRGEELEPALQA